MLARAVSIALLMLAASVLTAQAEPPEITPWPTTQIDVYKGDSGFLTTDDEDELPGESEVRKLEAFLSYAAKKMQDMGFPAPALEVIRTDICAACYRIYLDEIVIGGKGASGLTSNSGWSLTTGTYDVVTIKRSSALSENGERILPGAYITGAHELFHAVQDRTTYLYDDDPMGEPNPAGKWISEGTADAIAIYLFETYPKHAEIAGNKPWIKGLAAEKRFGSRLYSQPLPVQDGSEEANEFPDYHSSSFWRYLAEIAAVRDRAPTPREETPGNSSEAIAKAAKALMPGPEMEKADFSYLAKFLNTKNTGKSARRELAWLDTTLRASDLFAQPLGETYARFLTTTAGYWNHRYKNQNFSQDDWLKMFFDDCIPLPFKAGQSSNLVEVTLPEMAARCIRISQVGGTAPVPFDLQVDTASETETNQLWLGTNDGQIVSRRYSRDRDMVAERDVGLWPNWVADPATPGIFILTNAAASANVTQPVTVNIQVTASKRGKEDEEKAPAKAAPSKDPGPDGRADALEKRVQAAGDALSMTGLFAMQIDRTDTDMTIHLGSAPLALNAVFGVNGSGGLMDQNLTAGAGLSDASIAVRDAYLSGDTPQNAGDDVYIRIPRIDYGFTGTIEGAKISTTDRDGTPLFAVGPADSLPGPQREFRPSGRVTIQSFTPRMLIASYEARFVDPNSLTPSQMQQSQPTLAVSYTGQETFSISAPWARMSETADTMPVDPWGELESDMLKRLPPDLAGAGRSIAAEARRASEEDRDPNFTTITSALSAPKGTCDCSCAGLDALNRMGEAVDAAGRAPTAAERQLAACGMTCSAQYAICEGD